MIDRYTKAVLTVIAVCLCLITAQNFNFIPSAEASNLLTDQGKFNYVASGMNPIMIMATCDRF